MAQLSAPEGWVELRTNKRWYRINIELAERKSVMSGMWYTVRAEAGPVQKSVAEPSDWSLVLYEGTTVDKVTQMLLDTVERKMDEGYYVTDREIKNITVYTARG